jgi:serine protease
LLQSETSRGGLPVEYSVQLTEPGGATINCEGITATQCAANDVVAGTRYTATLVITNEHGSKSSPSVSITFSAAPAVVATNDPDFSKQWYLKSSHNFSTNAESAWATETGHPSVIVAVLDTGITSHPDLPSANLVPGYDMVSNATDAYDGNGRDSDPTDPGDYYQSDNSSWHGTHVSGIIGAADNNLGVVGVAPNVKIQPVRVLSSRGGTISDITAGIYWAIGDSRSGAPTNRNIASVLNLSIGGQGTCYQGSSTQTALAAAKAKGITVVTAAGNENGLATNSYPGNCYPTINVGATGPLGKPAFYSNYSSTQFGGVDISAPGGDDCASGFTSGIYSTLNNGTRSVGQPTYAYEMGTSMASPMVAGSVALMYSAKYRQNPNFVPTSAFVESIWTAISDTARSFSSESPAFCGHTKPDGSNLNDGSNFGGYGAGIIDVSAALAALLD